MDLNRKIQYRYEGKNFEFDVTYDLQTHNFAVEENNGINYKLLVNPQTKEWTSDGGTPSVPLAILAKLIQQSYGVFV